VRNGRAHNIAASTFPVIRFPVTFPPANVIDRRRYRTEVTVTPQGTIRVPQIPDSVIMSATNSSNGGPLKRNLPRVTPLMRRIPLSVAPASRFQPACAGKRSRNLFFPSSFIHGGRAWVTQSSLYSLRSASPPFRRSHNHLRFFPGRAANVAQDFTADGDGNGETDVVILLERSRHLYCETPPEPNIF
jgi:hypothetical protein